MRPHPLNPCAPSLPPAQPGLAAAAVAPANTAAPPAPPPVHAAGTSTPSEIDTADELAARAGGFHESSYELNSGLEISESKRPADVTVPGALGEH